MKHIKPKELVWTKRFTYDKVIIADENTLKSKGSKFQIVNFSPKTNIKPHYHKKTIEIYFIESGTGKIILNGIEYMAETGDIFIIEPGDTHEIINDTNDNFTILIFKTNEEKNDIYWGKNVEIQNNST